jgi:uncharacterized protein (TIGR02246 family)
MKVNVRMQTVLTRRVRTGTALGRTLLAVLLAGCAVHAPAAPVATAPAQETSSILGKAIQRESEVTVKAFNQGDAAALVAMFLDNGELVDEEGTVHAGTAAIKELFTGFFSRYPKSTLELVITSVRPVGDMLAVEEGARRITTAEGASAHVRYVAVRTKQGDRWPIASYREFSDDPLPTPGEVLQEVGWIVGDWVDEGPDGRTAISFRWSEDGNYLLGDYTMSAAGAGESKSTQRIGFDPVTGQLRSWTFDDDGGFTEGRWAATDRGWVIRSEATMPDGTTGSALLTVTVKGPDRFVIRGAERIVAGVEEPNFEVTITRKPPQPGPTK